MGRRGRIALGVVLGSVVLGAVGLPARGTVRAVGVCRTPSTQLAVAGLENAGAPSGIYVVRIDRPKPTRLTYGGANGRGDYDPAWSPDGRRIAFDRVATGRVAPGNLFVVDAEAHHLRQLTANGDGFDPSWSPDDRTIFYRGLNRGGFLSVRDDGSRRHRLANGSGAGAVSPDGRSVALGRRHGIQIVSIDGSGDRRVRQGTALGNVTWSPDGRQLAYETYGRPGIQIVNADGTGNRRLTNIATNNFYDWSPDGTRIAFADRTGSLDVVDTAGGELRRLRRFGEYETYDVAWSPDGRWIAFTHARDGYALYLIRPDGRDLHRVHLPAGVQPLGLAWRPCAVP